MELPHSGRLSRASLSNDDVTLPTSHHISRIALHVKNHTCPPGCDDPSDLVSTHIGSHLFPPSIHGHSEPLPDPEPPPLLPSAPTVSDTDNDFDFFDSGRDITAEINTIDLNLGPTIVFPDVFTDPDISPDPNYNPDALRVQIDTCAYVSCTD